ncbi:hypothetical protein AX16_009267 [Volvariella volvacea WC 439]|nr:hypothetical protein AX16_009267 [Volvariella volvacea WC 439]
MVELPLELLASIIDHLADDTATLKACSLVCRCLTFPAQRHLFRELSVSLAECPAELLSRPKHHLALFRSLTLICPSRTSETDCRRIVQLLKCLVGLTEITFDGKSTRGPWIIEDPNDTTSRDIIRECGRPTITSLKIERIQTLPVDDLYRFTSVTHLSLFSCAFLSSKEEPASIDSISRIPLKYLWLGPFCTSTSEPDGSILPPRFLLESWCPWHIEKLEAFAFLVWTVTEYRQLSSFVPHLPKSLTSLTVHYRFFSPDLDPATMHPMDFPALPQLIYLELEVDYGLTDNVNPWISWTTEQLFNMHVANRLSALSLFISVRYTDTLCNAWWSLLDDCLDIRFRNVRDVQVGLTVEYTYSRTVDQTLMEIWNSFPKMSERNALEILYS